MCLDQQQMSLGKTPFSLLCCSPSFPLCNIAILPMFWCHNNPFQFGPANLIKNIFFLREQYYTKGLKQGTNKIRLFVIVYNQTWKPKYTPHKTYSINIQSIWLSKKKKKFNQFGVSQTPPLTLWGVSHINKQPNEYMSNVGLKIHLHNAPPINI